MKLFKSIFAIALVASAFASCQKIEDNNDFNTTKTVSFIATTPETKTAFGEKDGTSYPTLWTANDQKVKVSLNYATVKDAEVTPASDFKTANFSVEIDDDESNAYTFYSASPASAVVSLSASYKSWNFEVPSAQKPTVASVDEKAQILVAKTEEFTEFPTSVKMNYSHFTAYGKMSFVNLELGDATINSISLTASKNWAGRWYYYPETGDVAEASASATITLETSATESIWFACAPVDLSGETLKVTVNTTNGPLVKEIKLPANTKFESGVINKFAVDMTGIGFEESKVYSLVTDLSELTEDSKVIIAAAEFDYAVSTTQNSNNRGQASVTKSDDGKKITDPGDNVQIFTLKKGSVDNTIAFNTGNGYIYAAGGGNNLRTYSDLDEKGSFLVELTSDGTVLEASDESVSQKYLRYNGGSNVFSCYTASSSVQALVNIYKLDGSGTDTPLIVVDDNEYTITVADAENGTVQASATAAKKGTEITLTINPAEGYTLDALTVKDAENNDITVNDNIFTMPASNVTVSATFKAKEVPTGNYFVKVTSATDLTDGEYLIVYEDGNLAFNGGLETLDAVSNTVSVEITENGIAVSEVLNNATFTYDSSSKTLKSASGLYIGQTSDANGLKSSETELYTNTISFTSNGEANVSSGGAYLRYNATSGQTRFRYYKSSSYTGQKAIALYKK